MYRCSTDEVLDDVQFDDDDLQEAVDKLAAVDMSELLAASAGPSALNDPEL